MKKLNLQIFRFLKEHKKMASCGLPNEFCFINLKKGVKVIGVITCVLSLIFSIQLLVYLCSDYDAIAAEISDNDPQVKENLRPHKTSRKFFLLINDVDIFYCSLRLAVRAVAGVLLAIFILYFVASIILVKGEKVYCKNLNLNNLLIFFFFYRIQQSIYFLSSD